jgi:hypothetical protein
MRVLNQSAAKSGSPAPSDGSKICFSTCDASIGELTPL